MALPLFLIIVPRGSVRQGALHRTLIRAGKSPTAWVAGAAETAFPGPEQPSTHSDTGHNVVVVAWWGATFRSHSCLCP